MRRYRLTRSAVRELNEIVDYIAADSPVAAMRVRDSIFDACDKLARQPGMGHRREDITSRLRIFRAGRDVEAALR
ncbi:MAG TPA: type II toxin-antitoxin system RelE/ParE family toxin [Caulobacteraceae bacterium]|jgi:plasmid stabilization system protein ParE